MPPITLDDDGYAEFVVPIPGSATPVIARLDLYEASNTYRQLQLRHPDDPLALGAAWCDWLGSKGLPGLSHGRAFRVIEHVWALVDEFKKKGPASTSADSAASTDSPSSA